MTGEAEELASLREAAGEAVALGSLIFHLELAQMLAREHAGAVIPELPVDDWAVGVGARGYEVIFLDSALDREIYGVTFAADGTPIGELLDRGATLKARALASATRQLSALPQPTQRTIVVLPPAAAVPDAPLIGYVIRRAERVGDVAAGVHWRVELDCDGRRIRKRVPSSNGDLTIPGHAGKPAVDITLLAPEGLVPNPLHVYLSLRHAIPLSVITVTNEEQWYIDGEQISLL